MAINNPYVPGDPYSYDLKWLVDELKRVQTYRVEEAVTAAAASAESASNSAAAASESAQEAAASAADTTQADAAAASAQQAEASAEAAADSAEAAAGVVAPVTQALNIQGQQINVLEGRMDTFASLAEGSTTADAELQDIRVAYDGEVFPTAGDAVRGQISALHENFVVNESKNLFNKSACLVGKYLNLNGTLEDLSGRYVSDFIKVNEGDILVASRSLPQILYGPASWVAYDSNRTAIQNKGTYNATTYTVPSGISFVRVTVATLFYNDDYAMIEATDNGTATPYEPYFETTTTLAPDIIVPLSSVKNGNPVVDAFKWRGDLNSGDIVRLATTNVKNQQVYAFSGNISEFETLNIGRIFSNANTYGSFEINATNVIFHCDNGLNHTVAHGLTIANNIQVLITTENDIEVAKVILASNGHSVDIADLLPQKRFLADEGAPYVQAVNSTLTDCSFSWTSRNINKNFWLFGDSYMSLYTSRWPFYLIQNGFDCNCIINAFAGEASTEALASLNALLELKSRPKYLLWALGMNNADSSTAVNAAWNNAYEKVKTLCSNNDIELVLATIPNTPTVNNSFKNTIIKASGYRYVDFAAAVGASSAGSAWFAGMLSSDNVHPTIEGAKALYYRLLADLPEIATK